MLHEGHFHSEGLKGTISDLSKPDLRNQPTLVAPHIVDSFVSIHVTGAVEPVTLSFNIQDLWYTQTSSFVNKEQLCSMVQSKLPLGSEYTQSLHLLWGHLILSLIDRISDKSSRNIELSWNIFPGNHDIDELLSMFSPDPCGYNMSHMPDTSMNDALVNGIKKDEYRSDESQWESLMMLAAKEPYGPFMSTTEKEISRGKWTDGEHRLFEYLVTRKYSFGQWKEIASFFPNRTNAQCRAHGACVDPRRKKSIPKVTKQAKPEISK